MKIKNKKIKIWDVGPDAGVSDRYTVGIHDDTTNWYYFVMNEVPFSPNMGISQYIGETKDGIYPNKNWGKLVENLNGLPNDVIEAIKLRIE